MAERVRIVDQEAERVISTQSRDQWHRREMELGKWAMLTKQRRRDKQTVWLGNMELDAELLPAFMYLKRAGIQTEFSCAGVSPLDEPEDHSLYAYITIISSEQAKSFIEFAMERMKHRLLVTYEPSRNRYDLSSFFIGHNRRFCTLMNHYAKEFCINTES
ncbi:hypothetical protein [Paenibacillus ihbetae]|uniref:Uncharacterized protein n=1 Tax=Paenibacillus ihbetae TaxID=1870820 RepID=A0ABX3JZM6_9BACL|nr:hypothetical protein [Paenibacillus ihbetae]OOC62584.1 hypothetical protein BBD40_12375 [Paenibacillus ihbetae]